MTEPPTTPRSAAPLMLIAAAVVVAGAGLLYVMERGSGKKDAAPASSAECAGAARTAAAVKDLARGEVAAMAISAAPDRLPPLKFNGPDGQPMTLDALRGQTVLLNLWATWCVPCRAEMPALDALQAELGSDKFQVAAINIDTARLDRPKAFFNEVGIKALTLYADPKADVFYEMKQASKALGLPVTALLDPAGCAIGLMNGPARWDSDDAKALVRAAVAAAAR